MEDGPLPTIVAIGARDDRDAMRFLEKFKTNSDVEDCYVAPPRDVLSRKSGVLRNLAASLTKSHWGMEMVRRARAGGARQGDRGEGRPLHRRHRLALQWARVAPSLAGVEVSEVGDVALSRQTRGAIGGRRAEGGEDALPQLRGKLRLVRAARARGRARHRSTARRDRGPGGSSPPRRRSARSQSATDERGSLVSWAWWKRPIAAVLFCPRSLVVHRKGANRVELGPHMARLVSV